MADNKGVTKPWTGRRYSVKEIYYTLQGEGANTGRASVFCRFAGCNLWSGREVHRESAVCRFCDTNFVGTDGPGGGKFNDPDQLAERIAQVWEAGNPVGGNPFVVCTGGEPLLQLDDSLVRRLHGWGFEVAVETNGTLPVPAGVDWICVSPKSGADLAQLHGNELKLVYPQIGAKPSQFEHLSFEHFYLQPMDGDDRAQNIRLVVDYCRNNPRWRLSLQTHKLLGIP